MTVLRRSAVLIAVVLCALGLVVAPGTGRLVGPGLAEAADTRQFRPGNIISDQLFYDGSAMSAADVQFFLESRNPRCVAADDGTPCLQDARQDTYTRPADASCPGTYTGAPAETAATIIAKVGQACGISQRVLLVIMQKEQGLVTLSGNNLTARRYERAMGYACPDTAPCNPAYAHLFNQVYSAAARYRYYANNAAQFNHRAGRVNTVRFHPNAGCGSSEVFIENLATAGLYNYTPYQPNAAALAAGKGTGDACSAYGNRNFWIYYTDWFGSTQVPGAAEVTGRYAATGGENGPLGAITANVVCGLPGGGCFQSYTRGAIYWSPASGARVVTNGPVRDRWASQGWERGPLGYPVSDTTCGLAGGGCFSHFQHGSVYWSPATGARVLAGPVLDRWAELGWERSSLGYPVTDSAALQVGGGAFAHFQNGSSVYWSPSTGARVLSGAVYDRWAAAGWERSALGYPVSDVTSLSDGGRFAHFQNGSVYWSQATGARLLLAPVRDRWGRLGWQAGPLGYPVADQVATPGGRGQVVQFQRGWLYWSSPTGAHRVEGPVRDAWLAAGGDGGSLGMPTSDVGLTPDGQARFGHFTGGSIYVHAGLGTRVLPRSVVTAWEASGWERGPLGYPTSGVEALAGGNGTVVGFEGGKVFTPAPDTSYALWPAVLDRYEAAGGPAGALGLPVGSVRVEAGGGGTSADFEHGSVYWSPSTGARVLTGAVLDRYRAAGGPGGALGYPTDEGSPLTGGGVVVPFERGAVYWTEDTGARLLTGAVLDRYRAVGGPAGALGLPTTDVTSIVGGGRFAHFQNGSVYWSPGTGARIVSGAVRDRWAAQGWENGSLGYPTTDVTSLAGGVFAHFQGGSVYSSPATGARIVSGAVRDRWAAAGWENGSLGYPTTDLTPLARGGAFVHFERGSVYWSPATGARIVSGAVRDAWAGSGWETGPLGFPTGEAESVPGGTRQRFEGGTVTVASGRTTVQYR